MKSFKRSLAVLLLGVAALAVSAASASAALPEFSVLKNTFTVTSGAGTLETSGAAKVKVTCTSDTAAGEVTAAKTVSKGSVLFKGCESAASKCTTSGLSEGEVKTVELLGTLGYISASKKEVGLRLEPASGKANNFAEFTCGTKKITVKNAVIGAITPVNTSTKSYTYTLEQTKGVQAIKAFEGGVEEVLLTTVEGGESAAKSGIKSVESITASTAGEIKA